LLDIPLLVRHPQYFLPARTNVPATWRTPPIDRLATLLSVLALFGTALVLNQTPPAPNPTNKPPPLPPWTWLSASPEDDETLSLRKTFEVKGKVKSAFVVATCDNQVTLFLNGRQLFQHDVWEEPVGEEVTKGLREGKNVIAAGCKNHGGPAGFLLRLTVE